MTQEEKRGPGRPKRVADEAPEVIEADEVEAPEAEVESPGVTVKEIHDFLTDAPTPSIGRIVRTITASGAVRPAIIIGVEDDKAELVVFNATNGAQYLGFVGHAPVEDEIPGTYHWPAR